MPIITEIANENLGLDLSTIWTVGSTLTDAFAANKYSLSRQWIHSSTGIRYSGYVGQVERTKYQLQN